MAERGILSNEPSPSRSWHCGTTYRITPGGGIGYVMWKSGHESFTLTAFDVAGESLGQAILDIPGL